MYIENNVKRSLSSEAWYVRKQRALVLTLEDHALNNRSQYLTNAVIVIERL